MFNYYVIYLFTILSLVSLDAFSMPSQPQIVIHFPDEANEQIVLVAKKCADSELKFTELTTLVREGKYRDDDEFKNFIHCAYRDSGYASEDGVVNIDIASKIFPDPPTVYKVMEECVKNQGSSPVDNTYFYFKCFQTNSPFLIGL